MCLCPFWKLEKRNTNILCSGVHLCVKNTELPDQALLKLTLGFGLEFCRGLQTTATPADPSALVFFEAAPVKCSCPPRAVDTTGAAKAAGYKRAAENRRGAAALLQHQPHRRQLPNLSITPVSRCDFQHITINFLLSLSSCQSNPSLLASPLSVSIVKNAARYYFPPY